MVRSLELTGLKSQLGKAMFDPENWHQSLSDLYGDTDATIEKLLRVGGHVKAAPFELNLDRIRGDGGLPKIYWTLRPALTPKGFTLLLQAIRSASKMETGIEVHTGHTAHVTISYRAKTKLLTTKIPPINWRIDEFLLVRGGGTPYRYEVLGHWPLTGETETVGGQLGLF